MDIRLRTRSVEPGGRRIPRNLTERKACAQGTQPPACRRNRVERQILEGGMTANAPKPWGVARSKNAIMRREEFSNSFQPPSFLPVSIEMVEHPGQSLISRIIIVTVALV